MSQNVMPKKKTSLETFNTAQFVHDTSDKTAIVYRSCLCAVKTTQEINKK